MHNLVGHTNTVEKTVGFPGEGFIKIGSLITITIVDGFFDVGVFYVLCYVVEVVVEDA